MRAGRDMAESLKTRIKRIAFNYFPAVWASGGRYTYASDDMRELHLKLPLNLRSRNFVGTIFGGSMFSATDPMYFMLLIKNLKGYIIWDKASSIRFTKPGRGTLYAKAKITQQDIDSIVEELTTKEAIVQNLWYLHQHRHPYLGKYRTRQALLANTCTTAPLPV